MCIIKSFQRKMFDKLKKYHNETNTEIVREKIKRDVISVLSDYIIINDIDNMIVDVNNEEEIKHLEEKLRGIKDPWDFALILDQIHRLRQTDHAKVNITLKNKDTFEVEDIYEKMKGEY